MNVFRLFLCLAGLVTFLAVRYFSTPKSTPAPPLNPTLSLPAFPQAGGTSFPARGTATVESLELEGTVVSLRHEADGLRYDLATPQGNPLASNLSDRQFKQQHPALYGLVRNARPSPGQ